MLQKHTHLGNIPRALAELPVWILARCTYNATTNKWDKRPLCKWLEPSNWRTLSLQDIYNAPNQTETDLILPGIVLPALHACATELTVLDLDHVADWKDEALALINEIGLPTERSVSGDGYHIFATCNTPFSINEKKYQMWSASRDMRWIAMTGEGLNPELMTDEALQRFSVVLERLRRGSKVLHIAHPVAQLQPQAFNTGRMEDARWMEITQHLTRFDRDLKKFRALINGDLHDGDGRGVVMHGLTCEQVRMGLSDEEILLWWSHPLALNARMKAEEDRAGQSFDSVMQRCMGLLNVPKARSEVVIVPEGFSEVEVDALPQITFLHGGGDSEMQENHRRVVQGINAEYFYLASGNKEAHRVLPTEHGFQLQSFSAGTFKNLLSTQRVRTVTPAGTPTVTGAGDIWIKHPDRRTHTHFIFNPSLPPEGESGGPYNVWRGFGLQAIHGRENGWPLLRWHIENIICAGDPLLIKFIYEWIAFKIQNPEKQPQTALIIRGDQGTGKNTFTDALARVFGSHYHEVCGDGRITRQFNGELLNVCVLVVNEAQSVSKAGESALKALVTDPRLTIEMKGMEPFKSDNSLGLIFLTNEQHIMSVKTNDRRYAHFKATSARMQDHAYFAALRAEIDNNEAMGAFMGDMLDWEMAPGYIPKVPNTEEAKLQRAESHTPIERWWEDVLAQGHIWFGESAAAFIGDHAPTWYEYVGVAALTDSFNRWADLHNYKRVVGRGQSSFQFSEQLPFLKKLPYASRTVSVVTGINVMGLTATGPGELVRHVYHLGHYRDAIDATAKQWRVEFNELCERLCVEFPDHVSFL